MKTADNVIFILCLICLLISVIFYIVTSYSVYHKERYHRITLVFLALCGVFFAVDAVIDTIYTQKG